MSERMYSLSLWIFHVHHPTMFQTRWHSDLSPCSIFFCFVHVRMYVYKIHITLHCTVSLFTHHTAHVHIMDLFITRVRLK